MEEEEKEDVCEICGKRLGFDGMRPLSVCEDCFKTEAEEIFDCEKYDIWECSPGDMRIADVEERGHDYGYRYGTVLEEDGTYTARIRVQGQDYYNEETAKTLQEALKKLSEIFCNLL